MNEEQIHTDADAAAKADYRESLEVGRTPAEIQVIALIRIARVLELWAALGFPH